jgi:hypothetical protein
MLPGILSLAGMTGATGIQFVGAKTFNDIIEDEPSTIAINSGLTGGLASGASSGDFVVAALFNGADANRTLAISDGTTDYTLIGSELYISASGTLDTNLRAAYKFITSDTDVTFDGVTSPNDSNAGAIFVFRGVNTVTPIDVTTQTATLANSLLANPPAITPVTPGAVIVVVGAGTHSGGLDTFSSSDLTNFVTDGHNSVNNDGIIGMGYKVWESGEFNPAAFTSSQSDSSSYSSATITFALRPA